MNIERVNWQYYPKSHEIPSHLLDVVNVFEQVYPTICSPKHELPSNEVLAAAKPGLELLGFKVESGKSSAGKISVPVLFGPNGTLEKAFEADAYDQQSGTVVEVEAGRGFTNHQFLKDLFEACMMHDVRFAAIAVRNRYRSSPDFDRVRAFFDTLYASRRLTLPLDGLLALGY